MRRIHFCLLMLPVVGFACCTGYTKYRIDSQPQIKIDPSLLGIWKAVEDTNKLDFVLVQTYDNVHEPIVAHYGSVLNYIEDMRKSFEKHDTAEARKRYEREVQDYDNRDKIYYITRFNNDGTNPLYQQWNSYVSEVAGSRFFNTAYRNDQESGYMLHRLVKVSADSITVAVVSHPGMKNLGSSAEVRKMLEKNINNKSFYSDTVHFYKVLGGDLEINKAEELANK